MLCVNIYEYIQAICTERMPTNVVNCILWIFCIGIVITNVGEMTTEMITGTMMTPIAAVIAVAIAMRGNTVQDLARTLQVSVPLVKHITKVYRKFNS